MKELNALEAKIKIDHLKQSVPPKIMMTRDEQIRKIAEICFIM